MQGVARVVSSLLPTLETWAQRRRQRFELAQQMSLRELRDIGISRCDAAAESQKPFWR
jgi:uncharacterized protein YjiS (DUF1127 family)